jgi:hypothetical protein
VKGLAIKIMIIEPYQYSYDQIMSFIDIISSRRRRQSKIITILKGLDFCSQLISRLTPIKRVSLTKDIFEYINNNKIEIKDSHGVLPLLLDSQPGILEKIKSYFTLLNIDHLNYNEFVFEYLYSFIMKTSGVIFLDRYMNNYNSIYDNNDRPLGYFFMRYVINKMKPILGAGVVENFISRYYPRFVIFNSFEVVKYLRNRGYVEPSHPFDLRMIRSFNQDERFRPIPFEQYSPEKVDILEYLSYFTPYQVIQRYPFRQYNWPSEYQVFYNDVEIPYGTYKIRNRGNLPSVVLINNIRLTIMQYTSVGFIFNETIGIVSDQLDLPNESCYINYNSDNISLYRVLW